MAELIVGWAPVFLRAALGLLMVGHGLPKVKGFSQTAGWLKGIGFKPGSFWAFLLVISEFIGGLALIAGVFTRVAAALIIFEFITILYLKVFKWKKNFASGEAEWDWDLLVLAVAAALFLLGAGKLSIDSYIGWQFG